MGGSDRFSELVDQVKKQKVERKNKKKQKESREVNKAEILSAKPEDIHREQDSKACEMLLLKAMDKESIEAIALLIPVEEGEEFKKLKMEAMEK